MLKYNSPFPGVRNYAQDKPLNMPLYICRLLGPVESYGKIKAKILMKEKPPPEKYAKTIIL